MESMNFIVSFVRLDTLISKIMTQTEGYRSRMVVTIF